MAPTLLDDMTAAAALITPTRLALPEHRQIELYSRPRSLDFREDGGADLPYPALAGALRAFQLVDAVIAAEAGGGIPSGATLADRLAGELYRVLRVCRLVLTSAGGEAALADGAVRLKAIVDRTVMILDITPAGLTLLESAVAYWLTARRGPYPAAYVETMLAEYYRDLVGEIRRFADENRVLCQFRHRRPFNRHLRLDCDNPRHRDVGTAIEFDIGPVYRDAARHPIDFFVEIDGHLHIIPVEALDEGCIKRADLGRWRARLDDDGRLPAAFRHRFARESAQPNQPMS